VDSDLVSDHKYLDSDLELDRKDSGDVYAPEHGQDVTSFTKVK